MLDDKDVLWTSMDCLAFAEAGKEKFSPLLIWIGVEPKSLAYELANTVADAITYFIDQAGFSGFEIGFLIVLPFLVIDLIVATLTMSMGMMMLPPTVISLPFKILFFVLIDGWNMLVGSLIRSYS